MTTTASRGCGDSSWLASRRAVAFAALIAVAGGLAAFNYLLPPMDTTQNMLAQRAENRLAGRRIKVVLKNCYDRAAEAQEARASLKLPDDLKSVYNAAFDKVITTPVEGLKKIAPIAQKLAKVAADLGGYLYIHPDKVLANGNNFQIADTATRNSLVALTDELNANKKLFFAEQARLQPIFQAGDPLRDL